MLSRPNAFARDRAVGAPAYVDSPAYRVPHADIATFERDGVVCLRQVLSCENIARLAAALDQLSAQIDMSAAGYNVTRIRRRIYDEPQSAMAPASSNGRQYDREQVQHSLRTSRAPALLDRDASGKGRYLIDSSTWHRDTTVRRLALDSDLPGIAAQLLGARKINFCDDQIFVKTEGAADRTAFHQDYTYFRMKGWQGCVMWICVDPADEEAGALAYVRGSHRWGREFAPNMFFAHIGIPGSSGESLEEIEANPQRYDLVRFDTKPGDIVIHHFRTVHGAGGNRSSHTRRALSLRYAGDDMRYWGRPGTPDQPYQHHSLQDGDLLDSEAFPVVWPQPSPGSSLAENLNNNSASAE